MPTILFAEDRSAIHDGTFWNSLSPDEKTFFIAGYADGYVAGQAAMQIAFEVDGAKHYNHVAAEMGKPVEITFGTLVQGVDKCYSDFRNSRLDVEVCVNWTVKGVKGETDDAREDFLVSMRRVADLPGLH